MISWLYIFINNFQSGHIVVIMLKIKYSILILFSFSLISCGSGNNNQYDSRAIDALDLMSDTIGELAASSYTLDTVRGFQDGTEKFGEHDVYMRGPDKMYIHTVGSKGEKSTWYDGKQLARYSFSDNSYAVVDAPDNIIKAIDFISTTYGVDIPAADFFYPSFTDDVLEQFNQLLFIGDKMLDGKETIAVLASNEAQNVHLWIDKATNLPLKLVMESKTSTNEFYMAKFSNFRVNPDLPDMLFAINPPTNSAASEFKPVK